MKARSTRLVLTLAAISSSALGLSTLGCSSDKPAGSEDPLTSTGGGGGGGGGNMEGACTANNLPISFNPMYSAFIDGSAHTFQIPAVANGVSGAGVKWTASDPSMVQIERGDTSGGVLITMLKAGKVTITASLNGMCGTSELNIADATEAQWAAGNARYNNMNPLPTIMTDANGIPVNPTAIVIDPPEAPPACTNCHGATATSSFFKTVSHTPMQTGGFSDTELGGIITMAALPPNGYFADEIIPKPLWGFFHKWNDITGDNVQGMVIYLRSLTPKAQGGMADFAGGFMRGRGGATGAGGSPATGTGGDTGSGGRSGSGGTASTGGDSSTGGKASGGAAGAAGSGGASGGAAGSAGKGGTAGAAGAAGAGGSAGKGGTAGAGGGN